MRKESTHAISQQSTPYSSASSSQEAWVGCASLLVVDIKLLHTFLAKSWDLYPPSVITLLGRPVPQLLNANIESANHVAATKCIKTCRRGQEFQLFFRPNARMGKKSDLSDFDREMSAIQGRLSIKSSVAVAYPLRSLMRLFCGRSFSTRDRPLEPGRTGPPMAHHWISVSAWLIAFLIETH